MSAVVTSVTVVSVVNDVTWVISEVTIVKRLVTVVREVTWFNSDVTVVCKVVTNVKTLVVVTEVHTFVNVNVNMSLFGSQQSLQRGRCSQGQGG